MTRLPDDWKALGLQRERERVATPLKEEAPRL